MRDIDTELSEAPFAQMSQTDFRMSSIKSNTDKKQLDIQDSDM